MKLATRTLLSPNHWAYGVRVGMTLTKHSDRAPSGGDPPRRPPIEVRCRLRNETRDLHHDLEQRLDLLGDRLTLERYRWVLEVFHGYYHPFEERLAAFAATVPTLGLSLRARAPLLAQDLAALTPPARDHVVDAVSAVAPSFCMKLPAVNRLEHLAGALYVLEGACLGGQVVAQWSAPRLGLTRDRGLRFFIGDAEHTAARWTEVLGWLKQTAQAGADVSEMVVSAREVFATLVAWAEMTHES